MNLKDLLSPFFVWQRAFEKPYTSIRPTLDRPGAPAYRGFHINIAETCVGCGSCHEICQNHAIDMVPTVLDMLGFDPPASIKGVTQAPIEGVSFAQTLEDAEAPSKHKTQYFEMIGDHAIYDDGWILSSKVMRVPWDAITSR